MFIVCKHSYPTSLVRRPTYIYIYRYKGLKNFFSKSRSDEIEKSTGLRNPEVRPLAAGCGWGEKNVKKSKILTPGQFTN
jgi:hypothetical protein